MTDVKRGFNVTLGVVIGLGVLGACGAIICLGCMLFLALQSPANERVFENIISTPAIRATVPPLDPPATPTQAGPTATPTLLQGNGDNVVQFTSPSAGLVIFNIECSEPAERQCAVWLLDNQGNKLDLLANDITPYSGSKSGQLQPATYTLEVTAPGPWVINITLPLP